MLRVIECALTASGLIPQPTEWQRIGNQIDAAMIFTRAGILRSLCVTSRRILRIYICEAHENI